MKTVNSVSGGRTSAYLAANYPADYNVFALVQIEDEDCKPADKWLQKTVSDKIGKEFIATAEDDLTLYAVLDLEQFLGREIHWVTGSTFDYIVENKGGWLPNKLHRFCTVEMKLIPIFRFLYTQGATPCEMRSGLEPTKETEL